MLFHKVMVKSRWLLLGILGIFFLLEPLYQPLIASTIYTCKAEHNLVYKNGPDYTLNLDIYRPAKQDKYPLLILIHGGGWYSGSKQDAVLKDLIPDLVNADYIIAAIDYRLAPRYKFPAQLEDIQNAIRFLYSRQNQYNIDVSNIALIGDSAGAHLASLFGLMNYTSNLDNHFDITSDGNRESTPIKAIVDMYGPSNLISLFEDSNCDYIEHIFGTSDSKSSLLSRASPVNHISPGDPPFLIIQGEQDEIVDPGQSRELYGKLLEAGVPATLITIDNCGHEFVPLNGQISPNKKEIKAAILNFLNKYLKKQS